MLYMSILHYFPNKFMGRIFGTCNSTALFITIFAPIAAEATSPTAQVTMLVLCLLATIATRLLRKPGFNKPNVGKSEVAIELAQ